MRIISVLLVVIYFPALNLFQRLQPPKNFYQIEDEDDEPVPYVVDELEITINQSEKGMYLGSPCDFTCSPKLHHVYCDPITGLCECEKKFPVRISATTGCGKPKKLGEQCFYRQSCLYNDQHSSCIQIHHNAICQCESGYHSVALQRPTKRLFCAEDLELLTSDFSALAGVITGIAVLSGLICFVLKLFTQARSPRPRHFANANLAPPILFSSDTGSRRPSLASVHSSGSSVRSYSARRFEKEREQKEEREMQLRLMKMHSSMSSVINKPPTPSPQSTDELLPSILRQVPLAIEEECASTSFQNDLGPGTSREYI